MAFDTSYILNNKLPVELIGEARVKNVPELRPFPSQIYPTLSKTNGFSPKIMSLDGKKIYGNTGSALMESSDDWKTRKKIYDFSDTGQFVEAIRELENGTLLVSLRREKAAKKASSLWVSNQQKTTFTKVLDAINTGDNGGNFSHWWGASVHGNVIVASEYGDQGAATHVFLSKDYGITWEMIFDYKLSAPEPATAHIHSIAYDPYWSRIWVSTGDGVNRSIHYSDDWGFSWIKVTDQYQPVSIIALPEAILFGSDSSPGGVWRIRRTDKNKKLTNDDVEIAYRLDKGTMRRMSTMFYQAKHGEPAFLSFQYQTVGDAKDPLDRGIVLSTTDGFHFDEIFVDSEKYSIGSGVTQFIGPTSQGNVIAEVIRPDGNYWFQHKAPIWATTLQEQKSIKASLETGSKKIGYNASVPSNSEVLIFSIEKPITLQGLNVFSSDAIVPSNLAIRFEIKTPEGTWENVSRHDQFEVSFAFLADWGSPILEVYKNETNKYAFQLKRPLDIPKGLRISLINTNTTTVISNVRITGLVQIHSILN